MPLNYTPVPATFGLLPEPERNPVSFITSSVINASILALILYLGATAVHVLNSTNTNSQN